MKRIVYILLIVFSLFIISGCNKTLSKEEYNKALESIEIINEIKTDYYKLPSKSKYLDLEINWSIRLIDNSDCASLYLKDKSYTLVNKIEFDDDYDNDRYSYINLVASIHNQERVFRVKVMEKEASVNKTIKDVKNISDSQFVCFEGKIVWIHMMNNTNALLVLEDNGYYVYTNSVLINDDHNYKLGDKVLVTGMTSKDSNGNVFINDKGRMTFKEEGSIEYDSISSLTLKNINDYINNLDYPKLVSVSGIIYEDNDSYLIDIECKKEKDIIIKYIDSEYINNHLNEDKVFKLFIIEYSDNKLYGYLINEGE